MGLACKLTNRFLNDACSIDSIYLQKEEKSRHRQNEVGNQCDQIWRNFTLDATL